MKRLMENEPLGNKDQESKKALNQNEAKGESSLKKDFTIVGFGIVFIILMFFLYRAFTGLGLEVAFPRESRKVVDIHGKAITASYTKISDREARGYFQFAFVAGLLTIFVFIFSFIVIKWIKDKRKIPFQPKMMDRDRDEFGSLDQ